MSGQYECPDCDKVVWHQCEPASYWQGRTPRRGFDLRALLAVDWPNVEESFHDAYRGPDSDYRAPTHEEAQAETGVSGRRKPGTGRGRGADGLD